MAEIDLVKEVLNHSDAEIIEYLYGLSAAVNRAYTRADDVIELLKVSGQVTQLYSVLKALDGRNKENDVQ